MNILLFNDNPVVRKLVALSAQKTKDILSVVSSVDEIDQSSYDLLIIDDALYADGTFDTLKECITFNSSLLMATRGNAIPAGFDNVINKPFLPTDLVDMFIQIEKKVSQPATVAKSEEIQVPEFSFEAPYSINLDEELPELGDSFDDSLDLDEPDGLDDFEVETVFPNILDKEEVQEVQDLLDDAESELKPMEKAITVQEIDDLDDEMAFDLALNDENDSTSAEFGNIDNFDFDILDDDHEDNKSASMNELDIDFGSMDDAFDTEKSPLTDDMDMDFALLDDDLDGEKVELLETEDKKDDFDDLMMADLEEAPVSEMVMADKNNFSFNDDADDELGDLEMQIQNAVNELDPEILDMELGSEEISMDDITMESLNMDDEIDELDMLDERELMKAIGEEFEDSDEPIVDNVEKDGTIAPHTQTLQTSDIALPSSSPAEGMEALQALLKALSNEDVASSLKGLNISININFGNEK